MRSSELLASLPPLEALEAEAKRRARNKITSYYPESGPLRRELYAKHMEFFAAGAKYTERAFVAGNRTGKTNSGAYEVACHATGRYPIWWTGRRFEKRGCKIWVAGDTTKTVRDILQEKLLGGPGELGSGMIPGDMIRKCTNKQGIAESVDTIYVRHSSNHTSVINLKSYQEGRLSFQGTGQDVVWLDEECPPDIYDECLVRLMTTGGILLLTFTPLKGLTEVVLRYLPGGKPE